MAQSQVTSPPRSRPTDVASEYGVIRDFASFDEFVDVYPQCDFEQPSGDSSQEKTRERARLVWSLLSRYDQHSLVGMPEDSLDDLFPDTAILGGAVFAIVESVGEHRVQLREVFAAAPLFAYQCQLQNLSDELAQAAATGNVENEGDTRSVEQIQRKHKKVERRLSRKRSITNRRDEPVTVERGRVNALGRASETISDQ